MDSFQELVGQVCSSRIRSHIEALQGPRHPVAAPSALEAAAAYIEQNLKGAGYEVNDLWFQDSGAKYRNLMASLPGTLYPDERVLVVAHYDTVAQTPGADDNASGIALLLELAAALRPFRFERTVDFIAVNLEENARDDEPLSGTRGSLALANHAREMGWRVNGAIVLESVAYAGDDVVQTAPEGIPFKVSEVGNFIAAVGNENSIAMLLKFAGVIDRYQVPLPYLILAVPGNGESIPDTRRSDHAPFWDNGFKSVMLTDTTNFRNPHYHQPTDTIETLNLCFATEVCRATGGLIMELAGVDGAA
ncbi:M28 family peptidase [Geomesophilobacter sediminis]|uniref:M28 family peptidase n=1 Tax=Geomesophilobacter sediminis TaxID=2798584 RepID=UPI002E2C458E|nr:M28 family peptidase [Geomesophilobacter sediminis]